jgi:hypothetical protein
VSKVRQAVDEPLPGTKSRRDHDIVDDVLHDPFDVWGLEEENDFSSSQIRGVPMEAELVEVERRARGEKRPGLLADAFSQTGDDYQTAHLTRTVTWSTLSSPTVFIVPAQA